MTRYVKALVCNDQGEFFDLDEYAAVGMAGDTLVPLVEAETIQMPEGSEHLFLPDRRPIVYDLRSDHFEVLTDNPYEPGEAVYPVAAFNAPGYTTRLISAYVETPNAVHLPLFSYGAVGWMDGECRVAAVWVDRERRQDLRLMPIEAVKEGVHRFRDVMPDNRLRAHLETCALTYGCPAAKNFFLHRYEGPLPTSMTCNARCRGCLSLQEDDLFPSTQQRMTFVPTPEEIGRVAVHHIRHTSRPVVSFGQGCEGEPLMAAEVIEPAIRLIRHTVGGKGTINMNTNASLPGRLDKLFHVGLDSIRVSMNSVRQRAYETYFRPRGYRFHDVLESIDLALRRGKFVSINYLNIPGFSDSTSEVDALMEFLERHPVHMIQWRNLNFDPVRYWQIMAPTQDSAPVMGIDRVLARVRDHFPRLKFGYFNPPKEKFRENASISGRDWHKT